MTAARRSSPKRPPFAALLDQLDRLLSSTSTTQENLHDFERAARAYWEEYKVSLLAGAEAALDAGEVRKANGLIVGILLVDPEEESASGISSQVMALASNTPEILVSGEAAPSATIQGCHDFRELLDRLAVMCLARASSGECSTKGEALERAFPSAGTEQLLREQVHKDLSILKLADVESASEESSDAARVTAIVDELVAMERRDETPVEDGVSSNESKRVYGATLRPSDAASETKIQHSTVLRMPRRKPPSSALRRGTAWLAAALVAGVAGLLGVLAWGNGEQPADFSAPERAVTSSSLRLELSKPGFILREGNVPTSGRKAAAVHTFEWLTPGDLKLSACPAGDSDCKNPQRISLSLREGANREYVDVEW